MEESNNKYSISTLFKKYLPVISIILLTFLLMIIFKNNKRNINQLIEESKNNLVSFYSQNLKPLFASTEITNEDVFNFALYQTLPIDKENKKLLLVSNEDNNKQVFEVKAASYVPYTNNYERFIDYLGLRPDQKYSADSILGAYKKEIYLSVLKSDKNAIAINPQLGDLQKAVLADLIAFSEKVNPPKTYKLFPLNDKSINVEKLTSFANLNKENTNKDFIFITPDTVFQTVCEIDTKAFDKLSNIDLNRNLVVSDMKNNIRINVDPGKQADIIHKKNVRPESGITHQFDSNIVRVIVPIPRIPEVNHAQINDSIKVKLERAADKLKMYSIKWESESRQNDKRMEPKEARPPRRGEPIQFHFNFDPEAFAKYAINFSRGDFKELEKLGVKADSFARVLEKSISDSIKKAIKFQQEKNIRKKQRVDSGLKDSIK